MCLIFLYTFVIYLDYIFLKFIAFLLQASTIKAYRDGLNKIIIRLFSFFSCHYNTYLGRIVKILEWSPV